MIPVADFQCGDCPWRTDREDMYRLIEIGETNWLCHMTASFAMDHDGRMVDLVEEPRNRICYGYANWEVTT